MMGSLSGLSGWLDGESLIALMGLNNIKFKSPLRAGDTIRVETEIIELRETSKADRGLLINREVCKNQRDETVAEVEGTYLIKRSLLLAKR